MISNSSFQLNTCTNLPSQAKQRWWCHVMMHVFIKCIVWNLYIMCTFLGKTRKKVEILCRKCHDDSAIHYTLLCALWGKTTEENNIWVKTIIRFLWLCIKHCTTVICSGVKDSLVYGCRMLFLNSFFPFFCQSDLKFFLCWNKVGRERRCLVGSSARSQVWQFWWNVLFKNVIIKVFNEVHTFVMHTLLSKWMAMC